MNSMEMRKNSPYHSLIEDESQHIPADVKLSIWRLESTQSTQLISMLVLVNENQVRYTLLSLCLSL